MVAYPQSRVLCGHENGCRTGSLICTVEESPVRKMKLCCPCILGSKIKIHLAWKSFWKSFWAGRVFCFTVATSNKVFSTQLSLQCLLEKIQGFFFHLFSRLRGHHEDTVYLLVMGYHVQSVCMFCLCDLNMTTLNSQTLSVYAFTRYCCLPSIR